MAGQKIKINVSATVQKQFLRKECVSSALMM